MSSRPEWLDEQTTNDVAELFREHQVVSGVSLIPTTSGDEAIFVVDSSAAARMREASLTAALMDRLGRKVWITTDASAWPETPVPLTMLDEGSGG